jgi:hypothetical protein
MLLAIDPGSDTGWGLFASGKLIACGLGDPRDNALVRDALIEAIIVEKPRINRGGKAKPNDMITLALKAGQWSGVYATAKCTFVEPWQWKGTLSKGIANARIWARLDGDETGVVDKAVRTGGPKGRAMAAGKIHNMIDGIGLGLHALGRGLKANT